MSSISSLLLTYLATGLTVGVGHCIGMCGPIVISFSMQGRRALASHLLYHCGRITTYAVLGGIMGATGSFTMVAANIAALQKGAMFFTGGLIVFMGLSMGGWIPHARMFGLNHNPSGMLVRIFARLSKMQSLPAFLAIGLVLGLLPCGPVYTALLAAARAGMGEPSMAHGVWLGMLLMLAFGLGTAPALLLVAKLANLGWMKYREKIYRLGAILMIGVGVYFVIVALRY